MASSFSGNMRRRGEENVRLRPFVRPEKNDPVRIFSPPQEKVTRNIVASLVLIFVVFFFSPVSFSSSDATLCNRPRCVCGARFSIVLTYAVPSFRKAEQHSDTPRASFANGFPPDSDPNKLIV